MSNLRRPLFNSNSLEALNAVDTQVSDEQFFNCAFACENFTNADYQGVFPTFSSGVLGTEVPEPSSLIILGSGSLRLPSFIRNRSRREAMKKHASLTLFAVLFFSTLASAQCPSGCLFCGGDFDPNNPNANGLANETDAIVGGDPSGAATYQNFIVGGQGWNITGLFTNNLSTLTPSSGYWEIRSGMSEGNGEPSSLPARGWAATFADANRSQRLRLHRVHRPGYRSERQPAVRHVLVRDGSQLPHLRRPLVQQQQSGRTERRWSQVSDDQFFNASFFGEITNADNEGVFPTFSSGVLGTEVPEPFSLIMFGSKSVAAAAAVRNRLRRNL